MNSAYPILSNEITKRGIRKTTIAKSIRISYHAFYNKMTGISSFTVEEAIDIQERFFPDMDLRTLFRRA